jgi:hypothetical protein
MKPRKATLRYDWKRLWPNRSARWWAKAALAIKTQHVRHNDTVRLRAVFAGIDAAYPRLVR